MKKRSLARQLRVGDRVRLKETSGALQVEQVLDSENGIGHVRLLVRIVPCSEECPNNCDCLFALFGERGEKPLPIRLRPEHRLGYLGNLEQLLQESQAIQQQIEFLQGVGETSRQSRSARLEPENE